MFLENKYSENRKISKCYRKYFQKHFFVLKKRLRFRAFDRINPVDNDKRPVCILYASSIR